MFSFFSYARSGEDLKFSSEECFVLQQPRHYAGTMKWSKCNQSFLSFFICKKNCRKKLYIAASCSNIQCQEIYFVHFHNDQNVFSSPTKYMCVFSFVPSCCEGPSLMNYLFSVLCSLRNSRQRDTWHHPYFDKNVSTNELDKKRICTSGQHGGTVQRHNKDEFKRRRRWQGLFEVVDSEYSYGCLVSMILAFSLYFSWMVTFNCCCLFHFIFF